MPVLRLALPGTSSVVVVRPGYRFQNSRLSITDEAHSAVAAVQRAVFDPINASSLFLATARRCKPYKDIEGGEHC